MSKLSDTTKNFRKYVIGFLIFAVVVIFLQNIYNYIKNRNEIDSQNLSGYAYIDEAFGPITYPEIPTLTLEDGSNPIFSISGRFSATPGSVNVYEVNKPRETLGNSAQAQKIADNLYMNPEDYTIEDKTLTWLTKEQEILKYNKLTNNITYINEGIDLTELRENKPDYIDIQDIKENLNDSLSKFYSEGSASNESTIITYLLADGGALSQTQIPENADFIRADMYQQQEVVSVRESYTDEVISTQPITANVYLDDPYEGTSNIIIANITSNSKYKQEERNDDIREYNELGIEISKSKGVYKLKTYEEAWEDVQDGKGSLRYLVKQGEDPLKDYVPLKVKRFIVDPDLSKPVFYATNSWTGYIYPIFYFSGIAELEDGTTADFIFYTKAIEE